MLRLAINLERSQDRWKSLSTQFENAGIPIERFDAVDYQKLPPHIIAQKKYDISTYHHFPRELSHAEIACFLSHRACWEKLIKSTEDWALIVEDDILISKFAIEYLSDTDWIPENVKIIQLCALEKTPHTHIEKATLSVLGNRQLVSQLYPEPMGCQGYLISREVATFALELTRTVLPAPVDNFLWTQWFEIARRYKTWRLSPTLIKAKEETLSTIGDDRYKLKRSPFWIRHCLFRTLKALQIKLSRFRGKPHLTQFK